MDSPMRSAATAGLQRMVGDVRTPNQTMLSLARSPGFEEGRCPDGGAMLPRVKRALPHAVADGLAAAAAPTAPAPSLPPAWAAT